MSGLRDYVAWAMSNRIFVQCHLAGAMNGGLSVLLTFMVATGRQSPLASIPIMLTAFFAGAFFAFMRVEWIDHQIDRELEGA